MIRPIALLGLLLAVLTSVRGELPAAVQSALARLGTEPPAGWACTLTTRRAGHIAIERFDPAQPAGHQWSLLQTDGRPPTAQESDRYQRYRETTNSTTPHPVFKRGDIDAGSARRVREDQHEAEYTFSFREGLADTLLAHLRLTLTVDKAQGVATRSRLSLREPYSPVIGLRVDQLELTTELQAPSTNQPQLPSRLISQFHGRFLYFKEIEETLEITYSDFMPVRAAPTPVSETPHP